MKKYLFIVLFASGSLLLSAQAPAGMPVPKRSPEQVAAKQTERMVRELGISDSIQRQKLYDFHLKYALSRPDTLTRRIRLERMQAMTDELEHLLTKEQFNAFMDKQLEPQSHRPMSIGVKANKPMPPHQQPE